jgi:DNA invertase Pin-like site-specific DNA recombinase
MTAYIAYYRVSTDKQGNSGLGLEAQRQSVATYCAGRGDIIAAFTEIESGRKTARPQLAQALATCRQQRATLVIARLDRLARNVAFIANLMESGVDFVAVDMPEANRLTIHILAAVAEHERELISSRTKAALKAAKARGVRLGNPNPIPAAKKAMQALKAQTSAYQATVRPLLQQLQQEGYTLSATARELNQRGVPTARGGRWYATTVKNILQQPLTIS